MINYRTKPDLLEVLSIILPDQEQTWLLRSCLLEGQAKSEAWGMLLGKVLDLVSFLKQDHQGIKRLLPLLFHSLQGDRVEVESSLLTLLRVAAVHEELRTKVVRHLCREILSSLRSVNGQIMILKGVVLAEMAYTDKGLRHCHDLDIFIGQSDVISLGKALESVGMQLPANHADSQGRSMTLHHESGFPVSLHHQLFPIPFFNANVNEVWARSQTHNITGVQVQVMSPEDNLLHTCGLMFCGGNRESLLWACDSWLIINQFPDLDWDVIFDCAKRQRMTNPLSVVLGYLAEELNAPIPDSFLYRLFAAAAGSPLIEREVALHAARGSAQGGYMRFIQKAKTWSAKWSVLQWMCFPTTQYVRWVAQPPRDWVWPLYYIYRPLRYLGRKFVRFLRNYVKSKGLPKSLPSGNPSPRPFTTS